MKKLSIQEVRSFIEKEKYILLESIYLDCHTKILTMCPNGHNYNVSFLNFKRGNRCKKCFVNNRKLSFEKVRSTIENEGYKLISKIYERNDSILETVCPKGHLHLISYSNFTKGKRCPICSGFKKKTLEEVRSFFEKEGYVVLTNEYKNAHIKLNVICPKGHSYTTDFNGFQQGNRCMECGGSKKKTLEEVKIIFNDRGYIITSKNYFNSQTALDFLCPLGHVGSIRLGDFQQGKGCCFCAVAKRKETCIKKYGVDNPQKNIEIALKTSRSSRKSIIKFHWKSNQELVCIGSWEAKVVDYLNANQVNFEWQPEVFSMPSGKTYRPDLYLVDKDVWVEIKGRFRIADKEKWDWFKSVHPTAELWNKEKLYSMEIKVK